MRHRIMVVTFALALVVVPAFAVTVAPADPWNPSTGAEENFYEIYNSLYGTSFTSSSDPGLVALVVAPDQVFDYGDSDIVVNAEARYAGSTEHFGYYQPTGTSGATLTELFHVTQHGFVSGYTETINPVGGFGWYLEAQGGKANGNLWFSEEALNGGQDHMILYRTPDPNTYLLAWEDLDFNNFPAEKPDYDYQDLVLTIRIGKEVIPEPASLVLLGLGVSGMAVRQLRRKR